MKNYFLYLFLIVQLSFAQQKTTTIYLIRHAEKVDSSKNPDLSSAGLERAAHWGKIFSDTPFDAVYSTDFKRTKQTAVPVAENKKLDIIIYDAVRKIYDFLPEDEQKYITKNNYTWMRNLYSRYLEDEVNALLD